MAAQGFYKRKGACVMQATGLQYTDNSPYLDNARQKSVFVLSLYSACTIFVHHLELIVMKEIYFAGGCFWGTEHYFKLVNGVVETEVGYANGHTDNPTYQQVCTDKTGFAETVRIAYDPEVISLEFLTEMYFKAIDPTSVNQQGHDKGTQYRTGIYYTDEADVPTLQAVYNRVQAEVKLRLAVELLPLKNFYPAEDYHQDYLDKNPDGYCHLPLELFEMAKRANR